MADRNEIMERAACRFPAAAAIEMGEYPFSSQILIVVDVGAFFTDDEVVDWEATFPIFGEDEGFGREFRTVVVF